MRSANVSSVLVGDGVALATEHDLARALAAGMAPDDPITAVTSTDPVRVLGRDLGGRHRAALMLNEEIRHLLIDGADGTVSVVSLREVMAVLRRWPPRTCGWRHFGWR